MPEPRHDPLRGHWTLIAEHRAGRPRDVRAVEQAEGDEPCPFCPGNEHLTPPAVVTVPGAGGWVHRGFPNKYPAVEPPHGRHEVLVETPVHPGDVIDDVPERSLGAWSVVRDRMRALEDQGHRHGVAFKNFGERAGATLRHPHVQIAGLAGVPPAVEAERRRARAYRTRHGACPTCRVLDAGARAVARTESVAVLAPWAPRFPYEVWIAPIVHASSWTHEDAAVAEAAAGAARRVLRAFRDLLGRPAYNWTIHTAPDPRPWLHWRVELFPRLGRVAGFEWGTGAFLCEVSPENAAARLREALA